MIDINAPANYPKLEPFDHIRFSHKKQKYEVIVDAHGRLQLRAISPCTQLVIEPNCANVIQIKAV